MKKLFLLLVVVFLFSCQKDEEKEFGSVWVTNYAYDADDQERSMNLSVFVYSENGELVYSSTIPQVWSPSTKGFEVIELQEGKYQIEGLWKKDSLLYQDVEVFRVLVGDTIMIGLDPQ